jgi:hypothetical protein
VILIQPGIDRVLRDGATWDEEWRHTSRVDYIVLKGHEFRAEVEAFGEGDLQYQWVRDDNAIIGANNSALAIRDVQLSDTGTYSLIVSNAVGQIISRQIGLRIAELGVAPAGFSDGRPQLRIWNGSRGQPLAIFRTNSLGTTSPITMTNSWTLAGMTNQSAAAVLWTDPTPLAEGEVRFYGVVPHN